MKPIPVILLTGCLGAGKTACLNHLLSLPEFRDQNLALLINEFGKVSVDGQLVRPGRYRRFDLNRGSLFCVCIKTDFIKALDTITHDVRPDLLLIEATGVADPCDLEQFMDAPTLQGAFAVRGVVCLVDAEHYIKAAATMAAARNQVLHADAIAINKTDLVSPGDADRLESVLRTLNPSARLERCQFGRLPETLLETLTHSQKAGDPSPCPPPRLQATSIAFPLRIDRPRFLSAVTQLGDRLLRMKGFVDFGDGPLLVESVFGRLSEQPPPPHSTPLLSVTFITLDATPAEVRSLFV